MKTKILNASQLNEAVDLLKKGELVALPTETVYGLGADAKNVDAIKKIFIAKGRPADHPLIVHLHAFANVKEWALEIPAGVRELAEHFWPGPLTMILKKHPAVSDVITGGLDTVAIRVPKHPMILEVINKLGRGIVAPSANSYQKISPTKPGHVLKTLDGKIAAILDGGVCAVGIESTIIDMTKPKPVILRSGAVTAEMIRTALGIDVDYPASHSEKVSGNMQSHYQPEKPLFLVPTEKIPPLATAQANIAILHYSNIPKIHGAFCFRMPTDKAEYAKNLYSILHDIDNTEVEGVYVEIPPRAIEWADVTDRLVKASRK